MLALLLLSSVLQGLSLPLTRQIDIAPTAARLLGLEFSVVEGVPMVGVLERQQAERRR